MAGAATLSLATTSTSAVNLSVSGLGSTPWITGVGTTGFTLNLPSSPTTATTFSHKVDTPSTLLVNNVAPINFANGGGSVFDQIWLSFSYEPDA